MSRGDCVTAGVITMVMVMPFAERAPASFHAHAAQAVGGAQAAAANAAISGHVTDAASAPVSRYAVVVFPTDRSKWSIRPPVLKLALPAQDGSFEVTGLQPGEYWVAATDPVDGNDVSGAWLTPETLERLSFRATRVTLTERQRVITVLRLIRR